MYWLPTPALACLHVDCLHAEPYLTVNNILISLLLLLPQRKPGGAGAGGFVPGLFHAQQQQPSSTAAALSSPEWATLLSRVGDELMLALLLQGVVFAPLPGGNYVQLAGAPVHTVSKQKSSSSV